MMRIFLLIFLCSLSSSFLSQSFAQDTLRVGYSPSPPFVTTTANGSVEGISVWLWEKIADDLNITYQLEEMHLKELLAKLETGEIDMSLNPLTVTSERNEVIRFSYPFFVSNSTIATRSQSTFEQSIAFITSFFSFNFFSAVMALFVVILFFGFFVWLFERKQNPEEFQPGIEGVWSGIWWSAVTMTTVGYGDKSPQTTGGRLVALVWMFTAIVIVSGFTASIASALTVNQLSWDQNKVEDFKEIQVGTVVSSATQEYLDKKFFKSVNSYLNIDEGLQALEKGEIRAFMYDEPILKQKIYGDSLYSTIEIMPIKFNLQFYSYGFSQQVDYDLREQISGRIIEMTERAEWNILLAEFDLVRQ
ncbi:transporter substrate-binding domain-containing protein [Rapidithrix thailandica]|uniref:Transporter substrate-binding domain-containing protein n=1 Tax=Rapidithrix thailandica TaxID=413964 RepID=A0AAW9S745_9BACT